MSCDNLDELRIQLPEEFRSDFDLIVHLLETKFYDLLDDLRYAREKTDNLTDKELGLLLNSPEAKTLFSEQQRRFLFAIRKDGLLYYVNEKGIMREKVFRSFRPDGNKLDGYIPSIGMNRFKTEDLDNDSSK
jgi:RNA ligase